jgi:hypothetical protein
MRIYSYSTLGGLDAYGQPSKNGTSGTIKMAINITAQSTQDNILYKDCKYVGLTLDKAVNDKYIINYNGQKLKVLYINPKGRFIQVFMSDAV